MSDETRYRISWVLCLLVLLAAICQVSVGADYSATGEQITGGVPVSTLVLFVCGLPLILINIGKADRPGINLVHALLVVFLSASLLGLPALARGAAARELIQIYEVFGFSYLVFLINRKLLLDVLGKIALPIVIALLALHVCQFNDRLPLYLSDTRLEAFVVLLTPFMLLQLQKDSGTWKRLIFVTVSILAGISFTNGGLLVCYLTVFLLSGWLLLAEKRSVVALTVLALTCSAFSVGPKLAWDTLNPAYDATHRKRLFIEYEASLQAPAHFPLGIGPGQYKTGINYLKGQQSLIAHPDDLKIPRDSNAQYQIYFVESGPVVLLLLLVCVGYLLWIAVKSEDRDDRHLRIASLVSLASTALFCVVFSKGIGILAGALLALSSAKRFSENERMLYPVGTVFASLMFFGLFLMGNKGYDPLHHQSAYNRWLLKDVLKRPVATANRTLPIVSTGGPNAKPAIIAVEAETAAVVKPRFEILPANDASGGLVLESPNDAGKGVGSAEYQIDVPTSGAYRFVARVWWEDGCSNSMAVSIAEHPKLTLTDEIFGRWHTVEAAQPVELEKGPCNVTLYPLEDGIKIDYFNLVPAD